MTVKLPGFFSVQKRLWQQGQEIAQLRDEVARLRAQNDSMRQGMRRCVTCEYRIDYKRRQDEVLGIAPADTQRDAAPEQSS